MTPYRCVAVMSYNINTGSAHECVESAWSYFKGSDLDRRHGKYMAAQSADLQREARRCALQPRPLLFIALGTEERKQVYSSVAYKRNDYIYI